MHRKLNRKLVIAVAAVATAAAAGGAYAATQGSGTNPRQAYLNDVAKRLNITPQQLKSALEGALIDQLQAEVSAGRLTQAQANAIKQRLEQGGGFPFGLGGPGFFGGGHGFFRGPGMFGGGLHAAASYLGLSDQQLLQQLASGKSLAQIAGSKGKSTSGLKQAMMSAIETALNKAVTDKKISQSQEQQILSSLSSRLDQIINATRPHFGPRPFFGHPGGFGGGANGGPPAGFVPGGPPSPPGAPGGTGPANQSGPAY